MFETLPEPKTNNPDERTWDHHGSYQWTYFNDDAKQRIKFFLAQHLHGRNLEVGGGWYLSYPNSVVLDLSSVCLSHNPAKDKVQFDLDELAEGKHLPFPSASFDSATMVSVWQYLKSPRTAMNELERILKPGSEVFIINGQGAGETSCIKGPTYSRDVRNFLASLGYDAIEEHIPVTGENDHFVSVCAAMPSFDVSGEKPFRVSDRKKRLEANKHPSRFNKAYRNWEMSNVIPRLAALSTFPVTQAAQDYLRHVEEVSQAYYHETQVVPLIFMEHAIAPQLLMLTPEHKPPFATTFLIGTDKPVSREADQYWGEILGKEHFSYAHHMNYFEPATISQQLGICANLRLNPGFLFETAQSDYPKFRHFVGFLCALPLNSFTRTLQRDIHQALQPNVPDLYKRVQYERAFAYSFVTSEYKQERRIDGLIETKRQIETEGIPIVRTAQLRYKSLLPMIRKRIT